LLLSTTSNTSPRYTLDLNSTSAGVLSMFARISLVL
jgi:hypothetical protein